ncbi:hypothetical protein R0F62_02425 [Wolbachia endosymbiont of Drosophila aff. chauvacae BK-2020]|uniref:hypothetical protein n=1 Tax=unclassified Wolbachia TaxID=2640676 RepID=UPI0023A94AEA|nr:MULTISPECIES: hypothetical protein [unclassified Wolbachia]MDE5059913.1 hypothetical protein [Wolbachia endosymbiont of Drosophila burlai]MDE5063940.1 hypothetical protein [Wolbachia endosymbiont of Drosophila chauvacae]MDU8909490.1 hypothetical protein [Wolbachia endosymbiont of Drosophila bocqueti]WOE63173.1 hypothetical protein R0F62_02425 [Wolbachia endosymbiont of Drosophila aff. chauvacae BK-2020]
MTKILTPQTKNLEPSNQVTNKDEKIFEKEEHQVIYDYFVKVLEGKAELKENKEITDYFISAYKDILLNNVNPKDIKPLSEENFSQFLLSMFKEIREQGLAREEKLNNDKIQQIITKCVADIRGTEAKDSSIKFVLEMLLLLIGGIKIDPKNISGSFMDGMKEKIPFLGKDKKEEDEPPLSDEEMVTTFLSKIFFPVLLSTIPMLIFGPTTLGVVLTAIGTIFAIKGGVEVLFSNNKKGTLYDPSSQDKDDTEKRAKLNGKILEGIDDILKTPVTEVEKGTSVSEQNSQGKEKSEQQPVPEQISQVGNEKSEQHDQSWTGKENKRREKPQSSKGKTTQVC